MTNASSLGVLKGTLAYCAPEVTITSFSLFNDTTLIIMF